MKKPFLMFVILFLSALFLTVPEVYAQTTKRVRFARGASSAVMTGRIAGYKYVDYILGVRSGQRIAARIAARGNAEIVVFDPNGENVEGDAENFSADARISGDYKIRVLMPRAFARRKVVSNYILTLVVR